LAHEWLVSIDSVGMLLKDPRVGQNLLDSWRRTGHHLVIIE
jgi:hypothetical protein